MKTHKKDSGAQKPAQLPYEQLAQVVRCAPLVSIDVIIENDKGQVLLGLRVNEPARGYWFVPGGRILKGERICEAFTRIVRGELGLHVSYQQAKFVGVFEHLYPTNFTGGADFGTHYVVLTHRLNVPDFSSTPADDQHTMCRWFSKKDLLADDRVHPNTKAYFHRDPPTPMVH